jgi:U1 small nuclear ribonucleoprotein
VYNIHYNTEEKKLRREFEAYGPIKRIRIVKDLEGHSKGYAFIEYEHKNDFKNAYKRSDQSRVDGRKVLVDFERARTAKRFIPRRLGGGKGSGREFPSWLEEERNVIKQQYPELVFRPPEIIEELPPHVETENKIEEIKDEFLSQKRKRSEEEGDQYQNGNQQDEMIVDNNINSVSEGDENSEKHRKKEKKVKKEKKEKKSKKDKKEKKAKKDKKEKKEKKEKRTPSIEIGEII